MKTIRRKRSPPQQRRPACTWHRAVHGRTFSKELGRAKKKQKKKSAYRGLGARLDDLGGLSNLGVLALGLFVVGMVGDDRLVLGLVGQTDGLGRVDNRGGLELGVVGVAVGLLLESTVVLHVELHVADDAHKAGLDRRETLQTANLPDLAHEAALVPCL